MSAWILRFPEHPLTIGGSRPVVVLHVSAEGDEMELEVLRLGSVRPDLKDLVQDEINKGHIRLIIDLKEFGQIDGGVVGQFAAAYMRATELGASMMLANLNSEARSILRLTNLDSVIPTLDSIPAALHHFDS